MTIPEEYGGNPLDDISEAIVVEELARVDASFSVMFCVHVGLCSATIAIHGNEQQKSKYLPMLAGGDRGLLPFRGWLWDRRHRNELHCKTK